MPAVVPSKLWQNGDLPDWQETLNGMYETVGKHGTETFILRHSWYTEELPDAIKARQPPHMTQGELVKLVEWKLTRGTFRPKLVDYAKAADPQTVVDATTAAFKTISAPASNRGSAGGSSTKCKKRGRNEDEEEDQQAHAGPSSDMVTTALEQLTKPLKGVGPATASLILAAFDSSCPFMSDEAIAAACGGGKADYTVKVYKQVLEELRDKAAELSQSEEAAGTDKQWTAVDVEQCLFVEALRSKPSPKASKPTAAKASKATGASSSKRRRAS